MLKANNQEISLRINKKKLTNLLLDILQHAWNFIQKRQGLVHPLLDHMQVGQHLRTKSQRSRSLEL